MKQKIGFFGGAFNPPSNVHINIAKDLINNNVLDKVIFVPVGDYYAKDDLVAAKHRFNMLKLFCTEDEKLIVEDILVNSNKKLYASDAFEIISQRYRNIETEIYFIMGSDNFNKISTWKNYEEFIKKYRFIVIERTESKSHSNLENITFHETKQNDNVSSTSIRKMIQEGQDVCKYLNTEVIEYINNNNLYINNKF